LTSQKLFTDEKEALTPNFPAVAEKSLSKQARELVSLSRYGV
jgi:hypothetical protein